MTLNNLGNGVIKMTKEKTTAIERNRIEGWLETLGEHKLPAWIGEHLQRYRESGEKGHLWDARDYGGYVDTTTLLLTTKGRKSGRPITLPLIYGKDGSKQVIVGSKGGAPGHPSWYLNLQANPQDVSIQVANDKFRVVPRTTAGDERQRLWAMMMEVYPPLAGYQGATDREIPVVVLEPLE
jgi:deazaflavin-dependent oxidoreductase (nitroreductase family)